MVPVAIETVHSSHVLYFEMLTQELKIGKYEGVEKNSFWTRELVRI